MGSGAPPGAHPWGERLADAKRFAATRTGKVSIGIVDEGRRFHGHRGGRQYNAASVVKVMLMAAYLRHGDNDGALSARDRALLGPMIKRSDNDAATAIRDLVGNDSLERLARRAGMKHFETSASWGSMQITARDQAVWMYELERYLPRRHREYAMKLLAGVIARQRWGIPPETPRGFEIHFKGGWAPSGNAGWTVNQVARLEGGGERFSIAILTRQGPSKEYGIATVRGIADRLLAQYPG